VKYEHVAIWQHPAAKVQKIEKSRSCFSIEFQQFADNFDQILSNKRILFRLGYFIQFKNVIYAQNTSVSVKIVQNSTIFHIQFPKITTVLTRFTSDHNVCTKTVIEYYRNN